MMPRTMTSTASVLTLCLLLLAGCSSEAQNEPTSTQDTSASGKQATLTESERQEGWQLLFTGQDLSNWRGFNQQEVPEGWEAEEGVLHFTGDGGGDLVTEEQYDNFELRLDWRISEGGNSGIMYNVSEEYDNPPASGPEYQIIDDEGYPSELSDEQKSGANYALHAPSQDVVRPAGEWNEARIVVNGNHVEHWLNGEKVVEYEFDSEDWQQRVNDSKFADWPGYAQPEQGHIVLQDHGDEVWFRNVRIRPLDNQQAS